MNLKSQTFCIIIAILMANLSLKAQTESIKMDNFDKKNSKDSLMLSLYQTFENFEKSYSDSFTISSDNEFFICYLTPKLVYDEDQTLMAFIRYDSTKIELLVYWGVRRKVLKRLVMKGYEQYDKFLALLTLIPSKGFFRQEWDIFKIEESFLFLKRERQENVFGLFSFNDLPKGGKSNNYPTEEVVKAILDIFILID